MIGAELITPQNGGATRSAGFQRNEKLVTPIVRRGEDVHRMAAFKALTVSGDGLKEPGRYPSPIMTGVQP